MAVKGQLAAVSPVFLPYRFQASTLVARLGDDHLSTDQRWSCKCLSQVVMPHSLRGSPLFCGLFILPNPFISNKCNSLKE